MPQAIIIKFGGLLLTPHPLSTNHTLSKPSGPAPLPPSLQQDYKRQMLTAAHALAVDAKNLLDVIDQSRLKMMSQARPH